MRNPHFSPLVRSAVKPFAFLLALVACLAASPFAKASTWAGAGAGNWSSITSPGWTTGGVPNSVGAVAFEGIGGGSGVSTTQDIAAGVTVGTITKGGAGNHGWTISGANAITLNSGTGLATIQNINTSVGGNNQLTISNSNLVLAETLLIRNASGTGAPISIQFTAASVIGGTGNVIIRNESSNTSVGDIRIQSTNTFTGSVTIEKGMVGVQNTDFAFGGTANLLTLGASGQGGTTLNLLGSSNLRNNVVVAANTGGTTLLASNQPTVTALATGTILLNGDLTVSSVTNASNQFRLTGAVSGTGNLIKVGSGEVRLTSLNTYTGNTQVNEGILSLADNASLSFVIGADGVNNAILGTGTVNLDGYFAFDLTGAAATGSWTIVDVSSLTESFGSTFFVSGFTNAGSDMWTFLQGDSLYTFSEATGLLTASAVPEPSTWALLGLGLGTLIWRARGRRRR